MRTISRPLGRFFIVLIVSLAWIAPRALAADGARPPVAPSAGGVNQWSVAGGRLSVDGLRVALPRPHAYFGAIKLTQITDTVYYANGSKAQGTLLISWPAFTTADQNTVAAGSLAVVLGADGLFNASLAPTTGSNPAGVYYTVVYQLGDGTNKQEYWAVPATDSTTISAVRAKLVPTTQAAQFLTRDVADTVYVHTNDDQTVGGTKTFVKSPAVPDAHNPTDAMNKESADAGYVHANDDQTVGGVKTFAKSPAVPDPANPTDVANKEYVDANSGGQANFSSPPPLGVGTPNTVIGSTLQVSASAGGDANYNALRLLMQTNGRLAWDFLKKDGSLSSAVAQQISFVPWFQIPAMNQGRFEISSPVALWDVIGGLTTQGRSNTFPLLDPPPGVQLCTVTHSGAGGAGSPHYHMRFADSNSGVSQPSEACYDPQGYAVGEMSSTHTNHIQWWQPQGANYGGGYTNMILDRGDPVNGVILTPDHIKNGVLSDFSSCQGRQGDNDAYCGWDDDGSYATGTLASLEGGFYGTGLRNTTASAIVQGTLWTQGGNNLGGGTNHQGRLVTQAFADPPAPRVQANTTGSTGYSYAVVYHDFGLGVTNPSPLVTIANGAAVPNNTITWDCYPSFQTADLLLSTDGGVTYSSIGTGLPCEGSNYPSWVPNAYSFTDTGQTRTAYYPAGRNTTADIYVDSSAQAGVYAMNGEMKGKYVVGTDNASAPYIFGKDNVSGHGYVYLRGSDTNSGTLNFVDSAGATYASMGGDAVGGPLQLNLNVNNPVFAQRQGQFWAPQVVAYAPPYSNYGWVSLLAPSSSGTTGSVAWVKSDAKTQSWHMGGDTDNNLTLTADAGGSFNVGAGVNVASDLTMRDIPGHAYFVSKYPGIQAAINAAYGSGTVSGAVIDDRTAAYSGPGFYVPDSVTVRLAPVPYSFTTAVTHNNGNNNVTAAIIVEQGAHLAGGGTSSNHGTTITVGTGFANDIIATTSVGTGTGAGVQWWHWGSIENLNIDGTNQTGGECVHVENMGETSKVLDLLVKNCYSNNVEFVGAAATQSDIGNISTSRSQNGSGVRFTNLSGVGKINGLSGDCNAGSLVSVQENAAGTLVITGLKSEAESTICSNGSAHDPVVLLDTLPGLNTHVHVTGGYAFGTAQNAVAKVVGSGGGILEMEGFYITGYTNLLNDTVRGVTVPATSMNSKQPFYYEPNGIVFANQAFTLTPGTGVMGGSTSLTPIFYATTGNATMVASLGNGDGQSIMTGGVELAGQNRTNYGATPEVMARAGYRFTGSAYDTTKWDFVPAWNAGDTTEKNLGNSLNVCQKSGSVSCRWNHVYGVNVDALVFTLGTYTVATLPGSYAVGSLAWVGDGANGSDCSVGHGSTRVLCYYTGTAWAAITTGVTQVQSDWNEANSGQPDYIKNKPTIPVQGMHLVSGTMIGPQSGIVGNGSDQNVFSGTIPAGTVAVGSGFKCNARFTKLSTSNSITFKWVLGATTLATQSVTSGSTNWMSELEVFTPSSVSSEVANVGALLAGTTIQSGPQVGLTASENLANASTLKLTFNATSAETITPKTFYCTTMQ